MTLSENEDRRIEYCYQKGSNIADYWSLDRNFKAYKIQSVKKYKHELEVLKKEGQTDYIKMKLERCKPVWTITSQKLLNDLPYLTTNCKDANDIIEKFG